MKKHVLINDKINKFKKKITVSGDKSLSIRWILMATQAIGKSIAYNLLNSNDVNNALIAVKKLGVKVIKKKNLCQINGVGLNGFSLKNNTIIDAGNSGTLARLIFGVLAKSNKTIVLKGDKSLSKRDFSRVIKPLKKFGLSFKSNKNNLPLKFKGTNAPSGALIGVSNSITPSPLLISLSPNTDCFNSNHLCSLHSSLLEQYAVSADDSAKANVEENNKIKNTNKRYISFILYRLNYIISCLIHQYLNSMTFSYDIDMKIPKYHLVKVIAFFHFFAKIIITPV